MTKKQKHRIVARLWIAAMARSVESDSFDLDVDEDFIEGVLKECEDISISMLGIHPSFSTLSDIIDYVNQHCK